MCFAAFVASHPLNCLRPSTRSCSLSLRRSILACERRPESFRPVQTSSRREKPSKNVNLFLDPRSAPALLRSPASILSLAALGFLSATAFLTRVARRFTADIAARTKLLLSSRVLRERLFARVRERTFLQSALEATNATLGNTQTYLDAQCERAVIAEDRLQKLQSQRDDLRELERRRGVLLEQLASCEDELAQREQSSTANERMVDDARRELEGFRKRLADVNSQCDDATVELADLECAAFDALDLVQKAAEERQSKLEETTRLICNARNAKNRTDVECSNVTHKVDQLNASVSSALSQVEEQRRLINDMTQRAEFIKNEIRRKRKDSHLLPNSSASNLRMKSLLDDVGTQQESIRRALSELEGRENREAEERDALREQLALREEEVLQLKKRLSRRDPTSQTTNLAVKRENTSDHGRGSDLEGTNLSRPLTLETDPSQIQSPLARKQLEYLGNDGVGENSGDESSLSETNVGFSETDLERSFAENPRENDCGELPSAPVLESSENNENVSPKSKRGRRKAEVPSKISSSRKPKQEGQPRGLEPSETPNTKTSPKRKRGRPKKNEVTSSQ